MENYFFFPDCSNLHAFVKCLLTLQITSAKKRHSFFSLLFDIRELPHG
jgi:hypothetical protein